MKNKKGIFLAEETIKIITSAVVILALVALLVAVYYGITSGNRLKLAQAKDSIKYFENNLNAGAEQIELISPTGWCLVQWPGPEGSEIPLQCLNKKWESCFCIQKDKAKINSPGACIENDKGYLLNEIEEYTSTEGNFGGLETIPLSSKLAGNHKVYSVCINSPILLDIKLDNTITLHKQ